jgi:hypothetical protein
MDEIVEVKNTAVEVVEEERVKTAVELWHEKVITLTLEGKSVKQIAEATEQSVGVVMEVLALPKVRRKIDLLTGQYRKAVVKGIEEVGKYKSTLIYAMMKLALGAEREQVQCTALQYLLDKLPDFAPTPSNQPAVQVNVLSREESQRVEVAVGKMEQMMGVLKEGNPNVVQRDAVDGE